MDSQEVGRFFNRVRMMNFDAIGVHMTKRHGIQNLGLAGGLFHVTESPSSAGAECASAIDTSSAV